MGGYEYILVIIDHYTWFSQAYATTNKSAKLFNDFCLKFGFPEKRLYDKSVWTYTAGRQPGPGEKCG